MIITVWHKDGSAMSIRRDSDFDVKSWFETNKDNFKFLKVERVEYELI